MTAVTFTHTTYNTPVIVYAEQVFAVMLLPTMKSTVLVAQGGASVPVTCTVDEANTSLKAALAARTQTQGAQ